MLISLVLSLSALTAGAASQSTISCDECITEMEGLGHLVKLGAQTIEDYLVGNYCPGLASPQDCELQLAGNYVPLLELVVNHYFVEGARHICQAPDICISVHTFINYCIVLYCIVLYYTILLYCIVLYCIIVLYCTKLPVD